MPIVEKSSLKTSQNVGGLPQFAMILGVNNPAISNPNSSHAIVRPRRGDRQIAKVEITMAGENSKSVNAIESVALGKAVAKARTSARTVTLASRRRTVN